jgi:hypothetical protein
MASPPNLALTAAIIPPAIVRRLLLQFTWAFRLIWSQIFGSTRQRSVATGVREPSEISKIALKRLAQLGRPRREAPTGQEIFADF